MERIIIHGSLFSVSLREIKMVIETLFPENEIHLVNEYNALWCDGEVLDVSVEAYQDYKSLTGFILSGSYTNSIGSFYPFLNSFIGECEKNKIIYNIEFEGSINGEHIEKSITHPDYLKLISHPKDTN